MDILDNNCIFCKIVKGEISSEIIYEVNNFIAILDNNPKAIGHTLIIPKFHCKTILDIPITLGDELLETIKNVSLDIVTTTQAEGINIVINVGNASGQLVNHAHLHLIPRKLGDGLKSMA